MPVQVIATHQMLPNELDDALKFCGSASKLDAHKVGWIPLAAYTGATKQRRVLICYNNGDKVGFCLWRHSFGDLAIYQIWVRPDARLILHGRAIVHELNTIGLERRARLIRLWCAEDLTANLFWRQIGFEEIGWRHGPKRTSTRRHLLWTQKIRPSLLELHTESSDQPEELLYTPSHRDLVPQDNSAIHIA